MTAVRFDRRAEIYGVTLGSYDPTAVEVIKAVVPLYARSWNPIRREWLIEAVYGKPLAAAMRRIDATIIGLDPDPVDESDWARALFQRVGPHRAGRVYKALSRCLHPDVGGDTAIQQELNAAHRELTA